MLTIDTGHEGAEQPVYIPRHRICFTEDDKLCLHGSPEAARLFCIPGRPIPQDVADELGLKDFEDSLDSGVEPAEPEKPADEESEAADDSSESDDELEASEETDEAEEKADKPKRRKR